MYIYLFIYCPLIAVSSAPKLCTMRHLGHLCPRDKSRINQTLSLIMCARLKGGKRGFRLDSPRVNLSLTCVIWRSVNTDYLADETRICSNFHPAHPQGERVEKEKKHLFSLHSRASNVNFYSTCAACFARVCSNQKDSSFHCRYDTCRVSSSEPQKSMKLLDNQ